MCKSSLISSDSEICKTITQSLSIFHAFVLLNYLHFTVNVLHALKNYMSMQFSQKTFTDSNSVSGLTNLLFCY